MPRRTNVFQKVVYLLQQNLAGSAEVRESEFLTDRRTGEKREVDVCIHAHTASYELLICIECTGTGRKATVPWVEAMQSKHADLPTNYLVLVSERGFTRPALTKAEAYGIETVTPGDLSDADAKEMAERVSIVRFSKLEFLKINAVLLSMGATKTESKEEIRLLDSEANISVYLADGRYACMIGEYIMAMVENFDYGTIIFDAPEDTRGFELSDSSPAISLVGGQDCQAIYLQKEAPSVHLRQVEHIKISGEAKVFRSEVPMTHGTFRGAIYSWGKAAIDGKTTVLVATNLDEGQPTLRFGDL